MKILFDNVDNKSRSGPNAFSRKLQHALEKQKHEIGLTKSGDIFGDITISFIVKRYAVQTPSVLRLDGIYFNSEQDFEQLNEPIKESYENADSVVFQTNFNKELTEKYFGEREDTFVINNGTVCDIIDEIMPMKNSSLDKFENVWCCASSWRPHKRLKDNISYFLEHTDEKSCIVVAGQNPDFRIFDKRVLYAGDLNWENLISLYKRSSNFIHLAWLDHCPNVVVDARAAGCKIICSDSGGTKEIAGTGATLLQEDHWNLEPTKLYVPPKIDFSKKTSNVIDSTIDIYEISKKYISAFSKTITEYNRILEIEKTIL
jgi:glycosyltransferase involved in cell wall biosynthesis